MKNITLNWPSVIEFGAGKINTLENHLDGCKKVFVLIDPPLKAKITPILSTLEKKDIQTLISTDVIPEPPFEALEKLLAPVHSFMPDAVVGIGGGSAMDLAKLVSVLFTGKQKIVETIGIDQVTERNVKLITVSTTSGTGSEVTPIAVLTDAENKLKKGIVSKHLVPDVAIVDPSLTTSVPSSVTAATGMDAMTHCIEAYTNKYSHPIVDNLALEGIRLIAESLETAVKSGDDIEARSQTALGSLYGGLCLGPVNTAAVHALAYPLGGEFKIPHGISNSVLLPFVMSYNLPSCINKYANIAKAIGINTEGTEEEIAKKGILKIRTLSNACGIPNSLKTLDIPESAIPEMAISAMKVTRLLDNNPRKIELENARTIFQNAFEGKIDL